MCIFQYPFHFSQENKKRKKESICYPTQWPKTGDILLYPPFVFHTYYSTYKNELNKHQVVIYKSMASYFLLTVNQTQLGIFKAIQWQWQWQQPLKVFSFMLRILVFSIKWPLQFFFFFFKGKMGYILFRIWSKLVSF